MSNLPQKPFCRLDGLTEQTRERLRLAALENLGLMKNEAVPCFEEAVQTVARFVEVPLAWLGLMLSDRLFLKATLGLSNLGLMNDLAQSRHLPRRESFCQYVVDSQQPLEIENAGTNELFAQSILFQHYGIRAYLGVPLLTRTGKCLGTLALMDFAPRQFAPAQIEFVVMTARWCLSEYEREVQMAYVGGQTNRQETVIESSSFPGALANSTWVSISPVEVLKMQIVAQLTGDLRTPLTSVLGMTNILQKEVYGSLTNKQKEYLNIIHHSGQQLLMLVEEVSDLQILEEQGHELHLSSVDLDMLCQQAIANLIPFAERKQSKIHLSVAPGSRLWLLDKDKVRQALYYLVYSLIRAADGGSSIEIHVSRKTDLLPPALPKLQIAIWVTHPWLTESFPYSDEASNELLENNRSLKDFLGDRSLFTSLISDTLDPQEVKHLDHSDRESLGLLLSCHLIENHGGSILLQGSREVGYRYLVKLPLIEPKNSDLSPGRF